MSNIKKYNDFISEAIWKDYHPNSKVEDKDLSEEDLKKRKEFQAKPKAKQKDIIGDANKLAKEKAEKANESFLGRISQRDR